MKKNILYLILLIFHINSFAQVTNYYSKPFGAINVLSTWGTNTNGTGTPPTSFNANNVRYFIHNRTFVNLFGLGNFIISGSNTALILGNGATICNLNIPSGITLRTDSMFLDSASSLNISGNFECYKTRFSFFSSVVYEDTNALQNIMPGSYGRLLLQGGSTNNLWPDTRTKILKGNIQIRNFLGLNCIVYCDTFSLTIGTSPTQVGTLSYNTFDKYGRVIGKMKRWLPASSNIGVQALFPLGSPNKKHQLLYLENTIAPATGGLVSAEYMPFFPGNVGLPIIDSNFTPPLNLNRLDNGFYQVSVESGLIGGTYKITANPIGISNVNWENALRMVRRNYTNSNWKLDSGSFGGGTSAYDPIIGIFNMTNFTGQYAIASDSIYNPLPIQLINFTGKYSLEKINLDWATASESNTKEFEIAIWDQTEWITLQKIKAAGNSIQTKKYSCQIGYSSNKTPMIVQLNCYDMDGSKSFSKQLVLTDETSELEITIVPNPFQEKLEITYTGLNQSVNAYLIIRDGQGNSLKEEDIYLEQGNKITRITSDLTSGIYFIEIRLEGQTFRRKQIKI